MEKFIGNIGEYYYFVRYYAGLADILFLNLDIFVLFIKISLMSKEIYKTFKEWSAKGYTINKGSKAKWINSIAHFSNKQVSLRFKKSKYDIYGDLSDKEDDEDYRDGDLEDWGMSIWDWGDN